MKWGFFCLLLMLVSYRTAAQEASPPPAFLSLPTLVVRALDKVTAAVAELEIPVGQTVAFGDLRITARTCQKAPPEEMPEAAAWLRIDAVRPHHPPQSVFAGWMFASSPAISALDHPVYDVWVIDCK